MIAVLTKYEALVDRVKYEHGGRAVTKRDVLNYAKKNVFDPLKDVMQSSAAIVQTHRESFLHSYCNMNKTLPDKGKGCEVLTEKTYASITDATLATIFVMAQQNSMKLACQLTFEQTLCVYFIKLRG